MKNSNHKLLIWSMVITAGLVLVAMVTGHKLSAALFFIAFLAELWLWVGGVVMRLNDAINLTSQELSGKHQRKHGLKLIKGDKDGSTRRKTN